MTTITYQNREWEIELLDDGSLDTVIRVRPADGDVAWQETRFSTEHAAEYRDSNGAMTLKGLRALGEQAADEYDQLTEWMEDTQK